MSIEIIHDEGNRVGARVVLRKVFQEQGPMRFGPLLGDLDEAGAGKWLDSQKDIADPTQRSYS